MRFSYDMALLVSLVNRWRLEMHMFHLPCGEMAPTLEYISLLAGLPCACAAVGARNVGVGWRDEMLGYFSVIQQLDGVAPFRPFPANEKHGPTKAFLVQFVADTMHPLAGVQDVSRHLEAYLMWLFKWVIFTETHGNTVSWSIIPYTREGADADPAEVLQYSWVSTVLAVVYRGLCDGCTKIDDNAILTGCSLLLQMWLYERITIDKPVVDLSTYQFGVDGVDDPTMGSLWCKRRTHHAYPDFVRQFDELTVDCVR
ncbi:protein MAINTENANCE OF MERISTEMS-like [Phragmites australis]|uniref:protein MAINTENANCE OF MERISTEMS-like n=1 Tax=Phragmites australis TaxID=29695 RepID=UPI002D79AF4B|nr:protein MAINTENANCE OF MERISTEMS-like [Phragmites australis]